MRSQIDPTAYWSDAANVSNYLAKSHLLPHSCEGDTALLRQVPIASRRILDLGTGSGHLIALLLQRGAYLCVGIDVSSHMLHAAKHRFSRDERAMFSYHDLNEPIPSLGHFDAIVTRFATHNLEPGRQMTLYSEIFGMLSPGGVFCNLDHVPAPTATLHQQFYDELGNAADCFDDPASKPVPLGTHLQWLRELEFDHVTCDWQWLEMALIVATKGPVAGHVHNASPSGVGNSDADTCNAVCAIPLDDVRDVSRFAAPIIAADSA